MRKTVSILTHLFDSQGESTSINQQVLVVLSKLRIFDTILTQCRNIKKSNDDLEHRKYKREY
ncbi:MAG TPA: hypothetical protein VE130_04980 [Nitrososphaeraceae archaeon]|nr:hypothetical protein [Nitrososphaeraceae archaeon]